MRQASAVAWLHRSVEGYCDTTEVSSNAGACVQDRMGSVQLRDVSRGWLPAVKACLQHCHSCTNCKFISVSLKFKDCSWFRACDVTRLRHEVSTFRTASASVHDLLSHATSNSTAAAWKGVGQGIARQIDSATDVLDHLQSAAARAKAVQRAPPPTAPLLLLGLFPVVGMRAYRQPHNERCYAG